MDEQALSELLECSVCLERLDHTSKVLPCQHTFCRRCLEEILSTQQELRCPECRTLVTIRVEDLPPNILLVRLLEGLKTQSHVLSTNPSSHQRKRDTSADSRQPVSAKPGWSVTGPQPCARALHSYEAREKDDLTFKKGDVVMLRRQVDDNWLQGELNGQVGVFPASYVQVLVPLPQCRALYDFQMDDEIEKDCLTFKKDQVISVIRKVDTNWIEGRKGDKIGILPLAFVELNHTAKTLISSKSPSLGSYHSSRSSSSSAAISTSSLTATTTTTPIPAPVQPPLSAAVLQSQTARLSPRLSPQKRHSFTPKSDSPSPPPQSQRHSLELSSGSESGGTSTTDTTVTTTTSSSSPTASLMTTSMPAVLSCPERPASSRTVCAADNGASGEATPSKGGSSSSAMSAASGTTTPYPNSVHMAMYNYRPQKDDELELRKGDYYTVSEKCQDGWYKGQCLRTGVTGVFPGNYVQVVRQAAAFKMQNPNIMNIRAKVPASHNHHSHHHTHHHHVPTRSLAEVGSSSNNSSNSSSSSSPPIPPHIKMPSSSAPPLLPRVARMSASTISSSSSSTAGQSSPHASHSHGSSKSISNTHVPVTITSGRSSRSSELSRSASALESHHVHIGVGGATGHISKHSSSSSLSSAPGSKLTSGSSDSHRRTSSPHAGLMSVHHSMSTSSNITPPNVVMGLSESSTSPLSVISKDKKEKREKEKKGLVKLWPGKSKKSKSTAADSTPSHLAADVVAHTRSGSFPSDRNTPSSPRESSQHRKTSSLDSSSSPMPTVRCKSQKVGRYKCIVPYPPQTEHEIELEIGDIVLVHKRREDGWYKGTQERTSKTGLFPGSFVEKCD